MEEGTLMYVGKTQNKAKRTSLYIENKHTCREKTNNKPGTKQLHESGVRALYNRGSIFHLDRDCPPSVVVGEWYT